MSAQLKPPAYEYGPGIYPGLDNLAYHAAAGISKSGLDLIAKSPAHYLQAQSTPREETAAMRLGTALHTAILEPERYATGYVQAIEVKRTTKEGRACWADFQAEHDGKVIISGEEWQAVAGMRAALARHESAAALLSNGRAEVSVFAIDPASALLTKARPDWLHEAGWVVDLKTTRDAGPAGFARTVANFRYQVQHAFYLDVLAHAGLEARAFVFIAVESAPPYAVGVYTLEEEAVALGRALYRRDLEVYRRCLETDHWPAYSPRVETLHLPRYAYYQLED